MAYEKLLSTTAQRAFLGTVVTQGIIVLVMIALTFRFIDEQVDLTQGIYRTVPCYLALFILAVLFETWMVFDALRLRNVIQLVGIICFHLGLLVFGILQIHETHSALFSLQDPTFPGGSTPHHLWHKVLPFLIVVPCVIGASWFILLLCLRKLYSEFGWAIFHVVGASVEFKKMYRAYQILVCLLKLDFFCFTGVTMQLLIVVLQTKTVEFGLTIAAIPVVLILIAICRFAVEREIKELMTISLILMLASQAYFIYKLVRFYEPVSEGEYVTTRATLTTFTIFAIILMFATFIFGLRCFADFDKGLQTSKLHGQSYKPVATKDRDAYIDGEAAEHSTYAGGTQLGQRMSIE